MILASATPVPDDSRLPRGAASSMISPSASPVPAWLRRAPGDAQGLAAQGIADVALGAGAAIAALDAVVRRRARWAGVWRGRLALGAAAASVRRAGRTEDEAALRDAIALTRPGDDAGPGGRMALAWRRLSELPAERLTDEAAIGATLDGLGLARDAAAVADLSAELGRLARAESPTGALAGAFAMAERYGLGPVAGAWFADALLAQRLGWTHALPLLGGEPGGGGRAARSSRAAGSIEAGPERVKALLAAQARAALRAIDLSVEIERRAARLTAVAPRLRARGAGVVVERLLSADAVSASERIAGMSDRALRRLFDRLTALGAVRELTGRPAFRIYGL